MRGLFLVRVVYGDFYDFPGVPKCMCSQFSDSQRSSPNKVRVNWNLISLKCWRICISNLTLDMVLTSFRWMLESFYV